MRTIQVGLLCVGLLAASLGDAQARKSYLGIKGGVNVCDISGGDANGLDSRSRFIGGVFYGIDFEDFGVRIDGLYVQKGAEGYLEVPDDENPHRVYKLDYLEFPVLFMVGFPTGEKFAVNLFAGPTFGFNVDAEVEFVDVGQTEQIDADTFEFGATFGGGMEYVLASMSIIGDVRYALSGTDIADDFAGKNGGSSIMVGVKFPLGVR